MVEKSLVSDLLEKIRSGDRSALGELLHLYRPYLRIVAERNLGPRVGVRVDASDIVQQTWMEAAKAVNKFAGKTEPEFSAWVAAILNRNLQNVVRNQRAGKRDVRKEIAPGGSATLSWRGLGRNAISPSKKAIQGERALRLAAAIEELTEEQRKAVVMRHLEDKPLEEISKALNRSKSAVAGLIYRGLRELREKMPELSVEI